MDRSNRVKLPKQDQLPKIPRIPKFGEESRKHYNVDPEHSSASGDESGTLMFDTSNIKLKPKSKSKSKSKSCM